MSQHIRNIRKPFAGARAVALALPAYLPGMALAMPADCFESRVVSPVPFQGNHDEVIRLTDDSLWVVLYSFDYLVEQQPKVLVCPKRFEMYLDDKRFDVAPMPEITPKGK